MRQSANNMLKNRSFEYVIIAINAAAPIILIAVAPMEYRNGLLNLAYFEGICAVLFIFNLIFFLSKKYISITIIFNVIVFTTLFFTIAVTKNSIQSLGWFLTLPVFVSLLLGLRISIPINLVISFLYFYLLKYINENSADFINIPLGMMNFYMLAGVSMLHEFTRYSAEKENKTISTTDTLTEIYNRQMFEKILYEEIHRVKRNGIEFSLMLFDIDNFSEININYGYDRGDAVLTEIINLFKINLRPSDRIFRYAGDVFAVIFADTKFGSSKQVAERIQQSVSIAEIEEIRGITFCAGLTHCTKEDSSDKILVRTEKALEMAKIKGKNSIVALMD